MEITPPSEPLEWDSEDTVNLRNFLRTQTGSRLLPRLAETTPRLHEGGEINAILIRSGEVRGIQELLKNFLALAFPAPDLKSPDSNYPPLTDDKSWEDGNTIKT
jgi:hypothetical protein